MPQRAERPFSIRMPSDSLQRLEVGARRRGEPKARTARRLIDEGLRMEEHSGIVFRDGPAGRRAALASGPDVWEVVETVKGSGERGDRAVAAAAEWGSLTTAQVNTAVGYYADFREEIDAQIALNLEEATRRREAWERAREALAW